jgi:hypothetical protein
MENKPTQEDIIEAKKCFAPGMAVTICSESILKLWHNGQILLAALEQAQAELNRLRPRIQRKWEELRMAGDHSECLENAMAINKSWNDEKSRAEEAEARQHGAVEMLKAEKSRADALARELEEVKKSCPCCAAYGPMADRAEKAEAEAGRKDREQTQRWEAMKLRAESAEAALEAMTKKSVGLCSQNGDLLMQLEAIKSGPEDGAAKEAYGRALHCGVGGHDGHLEDEERTPLWQAADDRCALAVAWRSLQAKLAEKDTEAHFMRKDIQNRELNARAATKDWESKLAAKEKELGEFKNRATRLGQDVSDLIAESAKHRKERDDYKAGAEVEARAADEARKELEAEREKTKRLKEALGWAEEMKGGIWNENWKRATEAADKFHLCAKKVSESEASENQSKAKEQG